MPRGFCQIYTHNNLTLSGMKAYIVISLKCCYTKVK